MLTVHCVVNRLVGAPGPGEQDMQRLDCLGRHDEAGRADRLGQQLAAEETVVAQPLVLPLERSPSCWPNSQVKAVEQVGPEVEHGPKCKPNSPVQRMLFSEP